MVEGGFEAAARTLLHAMQNTGVVRRYKSQPFRMTEERDGIQCVPDFMFECAGNKNYVVEVKCRRYLSAKELSTLRAAEERVTAANLAYLLWTDCWPLQARLWHLMRHLRRASVLGIDERDLATVAATVERQPTSVRQLLDQGVDLDAIFATVWKGDAHINLFEPMSEETAVTANVADRGFETVLTATIDSVCWWDSLPEQRGLGRA